MHENEGDVHADELEWENKKTEIDRILILDKFVLVGEGLFLCCYIYGECKLIN